MWIKQYHKEIVGWRAFRPTTNQTKVDTAEHILYRGWKYCTFGAISFWICNQRFPKVKIRIWFPPGFLVHRRMTVRWKICPSAKINQWQTTEHNFAVLCLVENLSKGVSFNYLMLICFSKRVKFPLKNCQNSPNIFSGVRNPVPKQGKKIQFLQPIFF